MPTAVLPPGVRQDVPAVPPDLRPLLRLIGRTRSLLRAAWLLTALALASALFVVLLLSVVGLDILFAPPPDLAGFRLAGLLVVSVPGALGILVAILGPVLVPLSRHQTARRIESRIPDIHNRLVSCLDLADRDAKTCPAFHQRLVREALDRTESFRPGSVVDWRRLRRVGLLAGLCVAVFVAVWLIFAGRVNAALARVFRPFDDIPPVTDVRYTVLTADVRWPRGHDLPFQVRIEEGDPASLRLELTSPGQRLSFDMNRGAGDARVWTFNLGTTSIGPGFEDGFQYRVFGGGTWSRQHSVTLVAVPVLESLTVAVRYPEYLGIPEPLVVIPESRIAGPVGGQVEVTATARGEVIRGEVIVQKGDGNETTRSALEARDGTWVGGFPLDAGGRFRVELHNDLGLANTEMQPKRFEAMPDEPPHLVLKRPGQEVVRGTVGKELMEVEAADDFGLAELTLVTQLGDAEPVRSGLKTFPPSHLTDFIQHDLDLTALGMKVGDTLRYGLEARDRKGQVARTPEFVLRVRPGPNTAEQQLAVFEKAQELVRDKFDRLTAEQAKVRDRVEQLAQKGVVTSQDMAALQAVEQRNTQLADMLRNDLAWSAEQMRSLPNTPAQLADQTEATRRLVEQTAVPGLKSLSDQMARAADPRQTPPDLKALQKQSDRLQKELEGMRERFAAVSTARRKAPADRDAALTELEKETRKQDAALAGREVDELRDHVAGLREEVEKTAEKKQAGLDKRSEDLLAQVRDLLDGDKAEHLNPQKSGGEEESEPNESADGSRTRQERNLRDLSQAKQSLASEERALNDLSRDLRPSDDGEAQKQALGSDKLKKARAMARRMKRSQASRSRPGSGTSDGNMTGSLPSADVEAKLAKLDPRTRGMMLKLPPRVREELLQSMEEKGPEGYRKFIDDYFRRLTEAPDATRGGR